MRGIKKHYHWVIFAVLLIEQMIYGGLLNNLSGMFMIPVSEAFQIKRFVFSLALSMRTIGAFVSTLFSGALKRYGNNKQLMTVGMFLIAGSCFLMGVSNNAVVLGIGFAVLGLCEGVCMTAAVSRMITTWFRAHQGTLLGAVTAGSGIGGSLVCMILTYAMERFSWRMGFFASGAMCLLLALLLQFALYDKPEELRLKPLGADKQIRHRINHSRLWLGPAKQELVRKPVFYLLLLALFASTLCMLMAFNVMMPYFRDKGFSSTQTAVLQSIVMIMLAAGKLLAGLACDAMGSRSVMTFCVLANSAAIVLMTIAQDMTLAAIAMVLLGVGLPVTTVMIPLLTRELLGYRSHDALLGAYLSMASISSFSAGYIANGAYDAMGSYDGILKWAAAVLLGSQILLFVIFVICGKMKQAADQ